MGVWQPLLSHPFVAHGNFNVIMTTLHMIMIQHISLTYGVLIQNTYNTLPCKWIHSHLMQMNPFCLDQVHWAVKSGDVGCVWNLVFRDVTLVAAITKEICMSMRCGFVKVGFPKQLVRNLVMRLEWWDFKWIFETSLVKLKVKVFYRISLLKVKYINGSESQLTNTSKITIWRSNKYSTETFLSH